MRPEPQTIVAMHTRLRVRPDVFFVRSTDGVWLRNNGGSFRVKGQQYYELVRGLFAKFDGTRTVGEVLGQLEPGKQAALIERVIEPLTARGFLVRSPDEPEIVTPYVAQRFGEHLAFLGQYVDRPCERLLKVREARVACAGAGLLLRAAVVAVKELGFSRVHVFSTDADADADALRRVVDAARADDEQGAWTPAVRSLPQIEDLASELATVVESAAAVVLAATGDREEVARTVDVLRRAGHCVVVIAAVRGFVAASPIFDPDFGSDPETDHATTDNSAWCWACLHRSVVRNDELAPAPPSASLAAFAAGQRLFCRLAGPGVPEHRTLTLVDARTLTVSTSRPELHPLCGRHGRADRSGVIEPLSCPDAPVRPDVPTPVDREELIAVQNRIVNTASRWVNIVTGPFLSLGEEELAQIPLSGSRCRVVIPEDLAGAHSVVRIECRAVSAREARNQVALFALEQLATATVQLRGERWRTFAIGAGWTPGEALFRAFAIAARRGFGGHERTCRAVAVDERSVSEVRSFLVTALRTLRGSNLRAQVGDVSPALVGAEILAGRDRIALGVGVDDDHAIDHALLVALAGLNGWTGEVGYPAPHMRRWPEIVDQLRRRLDAPQSVFDVTYLLPFITGSASLVAAPIDGDEASR